MGSPFPFRSDDTFAFGKAVFKTSDLKSGWDVLDLMERTLSGLEHEVFFVDKESCTFHGETKLKGPIIVGRNVSFGDWCIVRGPAVIGDGAMIGYLSQVVRSYIGRKCYITGHSYIGDSVLADEVFGTWFVTSNVGLNSGDMMDVREKKRGALIGRGTRIGLMSVLMPGTEIGEQSILAPQSNVKGIIPANSFVKPMNQEFEIRRNKWSKSE